MKKELYSVLSKSTLIVGLAYMCMAEDVSAQVSINSLTPYTQNFNTLTQNSSTAATWTDNQTLTGWYAENGPTRQIIASNGSDITDGLKSYGSTTSPNDRAFGCVTSSATGAFYYGVRLKNNTGKVIRDFTVSYTAEQWAKMKNTGSLVFAYKTGTTVTDPTGSTGWQTVSTLQATTSAGSGNTPVAVDGNDANNQYQVSALISDIELAAGEEIMFRWSDANNNQNYLGIDDVTITPSNTARVFYNEAAANSNTNLSSKANWTTNANGTTGTQPTSFTGSYQTFVIKNYSASGITANWTVSGEDSKVILGDGSTAVNFTIAAATNDLFSGKIDVTNNATLTILNASTPTLGTCGVNSKLVIGDGTKTVTFTIPAGTDYPGVIDVKDNATLVVNSTSLPTLGTLGSLSTVKYTNTTVQTLPAIDYANLVISGSAKNLSVNTRIKKSLTLTGANLKLGNYDLTLDPGATISGAGATNYIITDGTGTLKQQVTNNNTNVLYPVGTAAEYLPVKIKQAASATTDIFSVKVYDGLYNNYTNNMPAAGSTAYTTKAVNKTWIIDEAVTNGSNITLTLGWAAGNALSGFDNNNVRIGHFYNSSWDDYTAAPATLTNGIYEISRPNITSFSPFGGFSTTPSTLPVELVSFKAQRQEQQVNCEWQTASEKNNSHFTIERSADGREFSAIGEVKGHGTISQQSNYAFADLKPLAGNAYYRLRQVDLDGTFTFSQMVSVKGGSDKQEAYTLYPNPGNGVQYIKQAAGGVQLMQINIRNLQGELVQTSTAKSLESPLGYKLDLSNQPKGLYLIEVVSKNGSVILKALHQ